MMNFVGQRIIDKSDQVFHAAYFDSKWYIMPVHLRRMILMIQNRATESQRLSAGKMGEVSMEAAGIVTLALCSLVENYQLLFYHLLSNFKKFCVILNRTVQKMIIIYQK